MLSDHQRLKEAVLADDVAWADELHAVENNPSGPDAEMPKLEFGEYKALFRCSRVCLSRR